MRCTHVFGRTGLWALFTFIVCWCTAATAAPDPDSLRRVLNEHIHEDTGKVSLYALVSKSYRFSNPDSLFVFAERGLQLANKLHFEKGKADCLVALGLGSLMKNDLDKGLSYCNEAIAIYAKSKDSAAMEPAMFYIGTIYYNQTKYSQALTYYLISARLTEKSKNYRSQGMTLNNIGSCYSAIANYPEALNYFLKGLKVREQINDKGEIANSLGNIGQVYGDMGENKKAIEYVNKSIEVQEHTGDVMALMINYDNAGGVYFAAGELDNAVRAFSRAYRIADSAGFKSSLSRILCNMGEVYLEQKDYDKAFDAYQRCLNDTNLFMNPAAEAMTHRGMGRILVMRGDDKKGIGHLRQAMDMFRQNDMRRALTETADELRKAYEKIKDYPHALEYTNIYYSYRDSLYNEKSDLKVQQLQFDYELQKKQSQIELLNKNKMIAQSRTLGLISGLVLLLVIVILLFRSRQYERRSKEMIARQAANLDELNRFKDKIFSVLSHDLSGPLNSLSVTMNMLDENVISLAEFNELKPEVNRQLSSITFLLNNLLNWSKNYLMGARALKKEALNLHKIAAQSIALVQHIADRKRIAIYNDIPAELTATGDTGQVDIIIRNLVSNALKFTQQGGTVSLTSTAEGGNVKIAIADSGVGMSKDKLSKLFTTTPDNSTYGTAGEKGIGLGLLLCYEFIKANQGDITVTSEEGKGSTFIIVLPK